MTGHPRAAEIAAGLALYSVLTVLAAMTAGCGPDTDAGRDEKVTTLGSVEVVAELVEVPDRFKNNPLYNYVYVMKYRVLAVHRGKVGRELIYVGHYNPYKPRAAAPDHIVKGIGGSVRRFRAGAVHRMALEVPIDDYYMGGIINEYFGRDTGAIYWAVWTNRVAD